MGPTPDELLLRALYKEHSGPLLGYALRLTGGDRRQAEDVVQQTLLRAWRHPEALAGRPARPWLFTVVRNLVADAHRARSARGRDQLPIEDGTGALAALAAADDIERALECWTVAEALGDLSPPHRAAIVETYYHGRSVAEAAKVLGIPPGTVTSRAYYALRALKLVLEERGSAP
ncbi:MAG: polymerase, sigma-24 subunit, subfamily [Streptosporangiaceae bacterium]|nr:polymerase, sigma-24 subunit, subfamily [Streptosporangiaceae bacterium]